MNRLPFSISALLIMGTLLGTGNAQPPNPPTAENTSPLPDSSAPPPPSRALRREAGGDPNRAAYTKKGTIKAFNSAPDGATNGVILQDGTTVLFSPEIGKQLHTLAKEGSTITVNGTDRPGVSGRMVDAQSIVARGRTISALATMPPAPRRGPGKALRPEPTPPTPPPPAPKGQGAPR